MIENEAIETLLATGRGQQSVQLNAEGDPFFVKPDGTAVGLKQFFLPRRIEQTVTLLDAGSFAEYVNEFKTGATRIFVNVTEKDAAFTAIIDYHKSFLGDVGLPDYCRHVARFTTLPTPEWQTWLAANRKPMNQVEFATWLEDNLPLFVSPADSDAPSGADLLELVRTLHGHQSARFNTALRLNTGAYSVNYDEDVEIKGTCTTKGGSIELPPQIVAGIKVFAGTDAYEVRARLKSRISERRLALHFETISLHVIVRESIMAVIKQVATETKITPLLGIPS